MARRISRKTSGSLKVGSTTRMPTIRYGRPATRVGQTRSGATIRYQGVRVGRTGRQAPPIRYGRSKRGR